MREIAINLCKSIPTEPSRNIAWRLELFEKLAKDKGQRADFLALCGAYFPLVFKTLYFTFNPRGEPGKRNIPFITWPSQDAAIEKITDCIRNGKPLVLDKSRDEGATWIMMGTFFCFMLFENDCNFLVGSRKEEFVDRKGDHKCLFEKLKYLHDKLPVWFRPEIEKTHMHLKVLSTNSVCDGEATNENFGAGDRRTAIGLDEFGRVDSSIAENIKDTISDVTDCAIYNSTHFYGRNHPYAKVLFSGVAEICVLGWENNPVKSEGLYSSPDLNVVRIHDIDYFRQHWNNVYRDLLPGTDYKASDLERWSIEQGYTPYPFMAVGDGAQLRSPWFDKQERERSPKDLAMNVKRDPLGSSGAFFDLDVLHRAIRDAKEPSAVGEIGFKIFEDAVENVEFQPNLGRKRLKWWGQLSGGRPDQTHNYIVGSDISMGTGASHSSTSIYDVNTHEKCGSWVCAITGPREFAEQTVAICRWVGGQQDPFLIWESNGGMGIVFGRRVAELGYTNTYYQKDERVSYRPESSKAGWHSSKSSKQDMLSIYRNALHCRYTTGGNNDSFINYDENSLREAEDYCYLDASGSIGPSTFREAEDGATAVHGDTVISDGLCCLARGDQPEAVAKEENKVKYGSLAWRDMWYKSQQVSENEKHWNG